jgi:hypothetical protein
MSAAEFNGGPHGPLRYDPTLHEHPNINDMAFSVCAVIAVVRAESF